MSKKIVSKALKEVSAKVLMVRLHKRLLQQKWQNCITLCRLHPANNPYHHGSEYFWPSSILASLALFFLMAMTFADVVLRSVFNDPIESATELTRLLMAIIVFSSSNCELERETYRDRSAGSLFQ